MSVVSALQPSHENDACPCQSVTFKGGSSTRQWACHSSNGCCSVQTTPETVGDLLAVTAWMVAHSHASHPVPLPRNFYHVASRQRKPKTKPKDVTKYLSKCKNVLVKT